MADYLYPGAETYPGLDTYPGVYSIDDSEPPVETNTSGETVAGGDFTLRTATGGDFRKEGS